MKLRSINKTAQQEMVGFVLIVVLVVIALMVFLVISVRKSASEDDSLQSLEVENMLNVLMSSTTECAIVFEPEYDSIEDLIKSCYKNQECRNLDKMACDYLDENLNEVMLELINTESTINAYELEIFRKNSGGGAENSEKEILKISKNQCSGRVMGSQRNIAIDTGSIIVRLRFCIG